MENKNLKYEISQTTINNMMIFLKRVNLTGEEIPAWLDIVKTLNNPIKEVEEKKMIKVTDIQKSQAINITKTEETVNKVDMENQQ